MSEFVQLLQTIIPLLIAGGFVSPILGMCLIPIITSIMQFAKSFNITWKKKISENKIEVYDMIKVGDNRYLNPIFNAMCHFIMKTNTNNLELGNDNFKSTVKDGQSRVVPTIYIKNMQPFKVSKNDANFNISIHNSEINNGSTMYVRVRSKSSHKIVEHFISDIYEEYTNDLFNDSSYIRTNHWSERWESNILRTIKTKNNLFLEDKIMDKIINSLDNFINNKSSYDLGGLPYKTGFLFYGPPGNGKTSTINFIANYLKYNIYKINLGAYRSSDNFYQSMRNIPPKSVVVIEDIDSYHVVNKRTKHKFIATPDEVNEIYDLIIKLLKIFGIFDAKINNVVDCVNMNIEKIIEFGNTNDATEFSPIYKLIIDTNLNTNANANVNTEKNIGANKNDNHISLSEILDVFDGNEFLHECIICFTTNHIENIDPALIRSGRIDTPIKFDLCNTEIIKKIFEHFYGKSIEINRKIHISQSEIINSIIKQNMGIHNYEKAVHCLEQYMYD